MGAPGPIARLYPLRRRAASFSSRVKPEQLLVVHDMARTLEQDMQTSIAEAPRSRVISRIRSRSF
jgi:hypothetical protein